jgi:hypothetical protein
VSVRALLRCADFARGAERQALRHEGTKVTTSALPTAAVPRSTLDPRRTYLANFAALCVADPVLTARLDVLPFADLPKLEPTRDGNVTARIVADDGRSVYLHSRFRPLDEARARIERLRSEARAAAPLSEGSADGESDPAPPSDGTTDGAGATDGGDPENSVFLIAGSGLGYHLTELEQAYNRPLMVVVEQDPAMIKAALCVVNLAAPLREGRLVFITSADKSVVHAKLRPLTTPLMLGVRFVSLPHAARCRRDFHAEVRELVRDFVNYSKVQMVSLLRNSRLTCKSIAFNLGAYLSRPGVEVFAGRGAGYPAIVVAAGPSLARNIDQLVELQHRAVIIAVQTVFKTLLARGVRPHFVTSLDYHEISAQYFHGLDRVDGTILVAEPKANWHVLDTFRGRTHVLHAPLADDLLREAAPRRAALKAGSTVAHLCFYLAQHLACDPILFIGQDLSYSEGLYYPAGMPIEQIWGPELGRFQTIEMKQWERIARARRMLRKVRDIHGREAYTDDQMFTYAEQFQADFLTCRARVIHAGGGGMMLRGMEIRTLRDAAAEFCTRPLPADLFAPGAALEPATRLREASASLERRIEEIRELKQIATRTRGLLTRLVELVDRPDEFNRIIVRIDEIRVRIQRHEQAHRLVSYVSQLAELRRYHADRRLGDDDVEPPRTARIRLKRDIEYVDAFLDGCAYLEEILPEARRRLEERIA